ncbi:MAG: hypothetical protein M5R40_29545 [Anaerolineae bacterium]|nr:hypothetical protein [Anaerolineae bacterium]
MLHALLVQALAGRLPFPDDFFQCAITSIPYWGQRLYPIRR